MKKITAILLLSLLAFSCKKEDKTEPFHDELVAVGWYICYDRAGTEMRVTRPDSTLVNMAISHVGGLSGILMRKYPNSVGYETNVSSTRIRFKKIDGGYEIAGDTLIGLKFIKK